MDIEDDKEALLALETDEDTSWSIKFDAREFCERNKELKMADFQLSVDELHKSATLLCKIRKKIIDKSKIIKAEDAEFIDELSSSKSQESRILSTRGRSSDGLSEQERKRLEMLE